MGNFLRENYVSPLSKKKKKGGGNILENFCLCSKFPDFYTKSGSKQTNNVDFFTHIVNIIMLQCAYFNFIHLPFSANSILFIIVMTVNISPTVYVFC